MTELQTYHAVEKAVSNAKRELIQDHMEHCLGDGMTTPGADATTALAELRLPAIHSAGATAFDEA